MTTKTQNWYNTEPYKLIGHTVVKALPNGTIIEDDIVHKFNKADGKRAGSTNTAIAGPYVQTEKSVVQGYIKDEDATNRFLEDNDLRHKFDGVWYRPARPFECGTLVSGEDFRTWHESISGWTYSDIHPGQCLWVVDEDQSNEQPEAEPELTEDELEVVRNVAAYANSGTTDGQIDEYIREEMQTMQRIKAAVLRARGGAV